MFKERNRILHRGIKSPNSHQQKRVKYKIFVISIILAHCLAKKCSSLSIPVKLLYVKLQSLHHTYHENLSDPIITSVLSNIEKIKARSILNKIELVDFIVTRGLGLNYKFFWILSCAYIHSRRICLVWWAILPSKIASGEVGVWLPWGCPALVLPAPGNWGHF